ncbi:MAG: SET domain-containing protein-lysine N-methyltransferase [Parcubacteria group bacterium]
MFKFPPVIIGVKPSKMLPGEAGLFALRSLKKGTIIIDHDFSYSDKFFGKDVYEKLDRITKEVVGHFGTQVQDGFYAVPNMNYMPIAWLGNHSCEPNMGYDKKGSLILIKNVKSGEELTHDYGFSVTDPEYKMPCLCGSKNCRKIITGNDWKNPEYFKKNKKYMNV